MSNEYKPFLALLDLIAVLIFSAKTNCLAKNCITLFALNRIPGLDKIANAFFILFLTSVLLPCAIILSAMLRAIVAILTIDDLLPPI